MPRRARGRCARSIMSAKRGRESSALDAVASIAQHCLAGGH